MEDKMEKILRTVLKVLTSINNKGNNHETQHHYGNSCHPTHGWFTKRAAGTPRTDPRQHNASKPNLDGRNAPIQGTSVRKVLSYYEPGTSGDRKVCEGKVDQRRSQSIGDNFGKGTSGMPGRVKGASIQGRGW